MKTMIKANIGSPVEEEFTNILQQLDIKTGTPEQKQTILDQIRIELNAILPDGNWLACTTREQFTAELERLKKVTTEDPGASLRNAIRTKRTENKK